MKFADLFKNRFQYGEQDQKVIESLNLESLALSSLEGMKQTDGWKLLSDKLREELVQAINEKIKGDVKIDLILQILSTVETKHASKLLEEEIDKLIPN